MTKSKKSKIALIIVGILVLIMAVGLCVRMGSSQTYTKLGATDYEVGTLDNTGVFMKNAGSFVSKDFYDIKGLSVKVDEDADLSYQLYFYDAEENFISATNNFGVTYNGVIPEDAELFKIVITPTNDDDISTFDIINYSADVTVRYYK